MSSLLDIDLDYFASHPDPIPKLNEFLNWENNPVNFIVERHHHNLRHWSKFIKKGVISIPSHILHIDEHHDMMDEKKTPNIANFIYLAMVKWPKCCVHWVVDHPIDSPEMWLSEDAWSFVSKRFSVGENIPKKWPKPNIISVCTSPEFIGEQLRFELLEYIEAFNEKYISKKHNKRIKSTTNNHAV